MSEIVIQHFTDSIFYSIKQIARYLEIDGQEFFRKIVSEITPEEFSTLDVIICNPDICQRDLAKLILRDRVRTGRILDSLEEKGMISRYGDMKNKRLVKKMKITELGKEKFNEIYAKFAPYQDKFCEKISFAQREDLKKLLDLLKDALSSVTKVQV